MSGISALIRRDRGDDLSAMRGHSEKTAIYKPRNRLTPDTGCAGTLILAGLASRTFRHQWLPI